MTFMKMTLVAGIAASISLAAASAGDFSRPDVIVFGATASALESALADQCDEMTTRKIDPPFLPNVQTEQLQIDCDGFDFFGKPRFVEFVIADDSLEMVWILTDAEDEDEFRKAMTRAYGAPQVISGDMELFTEARAGLRKDIPEILFYSDTLAPAMEAFHRAEAGK